MITAVYHVEGRRPSALEVWPESAVPGGMRPESTCKSFCLNAESTRAPLSGGFLAAPLVAVLVSLALAAGCLLFSGPSSAQEAGEVQKMASAMPKAPRVAPAEPRKLLVFTLCKGYAHSSIPYAAKALEIMGNETGAFTAVVSDDVGMFAPEKLRAFDAVCMDNTTGELFDDPALKQSLLDFVKGGKGIVGIHAATDCFYNWAEYGEMMGGYFDGHPWGAGDTVGIKLDDPAHPVNAAFKGRGFRVKDEIYQFKAPYSRDELRVLLSIDTANSDMTKKGIKRTDGDFAVAWVRSYGAGRVFYCSLGHNHEIFWNPPILQHYLDGIQFALGDLEADMAPSAVLPDTYFVESKASLEQQILAQAFRDIARCRYGEEPQDFAIIEEHVIASRDVPATRRQLAAQLTRVLASGASSAGRLFAAKQLWRIGAAEDVPPLAKLLTDPAKAETARYALERIPGPEATSALLAALPNVYGSVRAGVVDSLGERRDSAAVPALEWLVGNADAASATAALAALAKIGGDEALAILSKVAMEGPARLRPAAADAYLRCADSLLAEGATVKAAAIYREVFDQRGLPSLRPAAFRGLVMAAEDKADLVIGVLHGDDPELRVVAVTVAREIPCEFATVAFARELPALDTDVQALMLGVLADRPRVGAAMGAAVRAARVRVPRVRCAALVALGSIGDASTVPLLAEAAATAMEEEADIARASLAVLKDDPKSGLGTIDDAIAARLGEAPVAERVELVSALAARLANADYLWEWIPKEQDASVRAAAYDALLEVASGMKVETLPKLVAFLIRESDDAAREKAEAALTALALEIPAESDAAGPSPEGFVQVEDEDTRSKAIRDGWRSARGNAPARCALVRVLGELGGTKALKTVRVASKSRNDEIKATAVHVLAQWATADALPDLERIAKTSKDEALRALALRGYLRVAGLPNERPAAEQLELYERAIALVQSTEEKKRVVAALASVPDPRVLEVLEGFLDDPELKADVENAIGRLKNSKLEPSASHGVGSVGFAIDGNIETRWSTGEHQHDGMWFVLDLGWENWVSGLVLDTTPSAGDYPRGYAVYVANNLDNMGAPVATGKGTEAVTEISFKPVAGRFIKIIQTGSTNDPWWSIHELTVKKN